MNKQIAPLLFLQVIDQKILRLKRKLEECPKALRTVERKVAERQTTLDQKNETTKELQVKINLKEDDLKEHESRIQKFREQQTAKGIKNKEYQALSHEIEGEKANSSIVADEVLEMLSKLETHQKEEDQFQKELDSAKELLTAKKLEIESKSNDFQKQLSEIEKERGDATGEVSRDLMLRYERIILGKGNTALAEVVSNVCQECYISLTPQMALSVRSENEVINCQSCGRILYIQ